MMFKITPHNNYETIFCYCTSFEQILDNMNHLADLYYDYFLLYSCTIDFYKKSSFICGLPMKVKYLMDAKKQ